MDYVLAKVVKIVNTIKSRSLNTRLFGSLLEEMGSHYTTLPYYTKIRWLSCQKVLKRFVELKEEIILFLEMKFEDVTELKCPKWHMDLLFLTDITDHLAQLNLNLQGRNHLITDMYDQIRGFQTKLMLFSHQLKKNDVTYFPELKKYKDQNPNIDVRCYESHIGKLKESFQERFLDFQSCSDDFELFVSPFSYDITKADPTLQMELAEIQCNNLLKEKYRNDSIAKFYSQLPSKYIEVRTFAAKILSFFGSTYLCEQLFSIMNLNKNEKRTSLTNEHLVSILKVSTAQDLKPDIDQLVAKKRHQASSSQNSQK